MAFQPGKHRTDHQRSSNICEPSIDLSLARSIRSLKIKEDRLGDKDVSPVNFNAGGDIALRNEQEWTSIRTAFEETVRKAEVIHGSTLNWISVLCEAPKVFSHFRWSIRK